MATHRSKLLVRTVLTATLLIVAMQAVPASGRTMVPQTPLPTGVGPKGIAIGDVNGDGRKDVVVANFRSSNVSVYTQTLAGNLSLTDTITVPGMSNPGSVAIADFTGDGVNDILVGDSWAQRVHIFQREGTVWTWVYSVPTFATYGTAGGPFANPFKLGLGDADLNGLTDMLIPKYYTAHIDPNNQSAFQVDNGGMKFERQWVSQRGLTYTDIIAEAKAGFPSSYVVATSPSGVFAITQDFGAHWRQRGEGPLSGINAIDSYGSNNMWAVGNAGTIAYSRNGGHDWINIPATDPTSLNDVCVAGTSLIYAVGNGGTVRYSTDGATFASIDQTVAPAASFQTCTFAGSSGMAAGLGGVVVGLAKIAGTWNSNLYPAPGSPNLYGSTFLGGKIFFVGSGGAMLSSTGATPTAEVSGVGTTLYDVQGVTTLVGYAVGAGGTVIKTADGGTTWTRLAVPTVANLHGVRFFDTLDGYVVGEGGTILHSTNGGATWTDQSNNLNGMTTGFDMTFASAVSPYSGLIQDFDDDGKPDLGVAGFKSGTFIPHYLAGWDYPSLSWVAVPDVHPALGTQLLGVVGADVNSDGHNDVSVIGYKGATGDPRGTLSVSLQNCISWLSDPASQVLQTGIGPQAIAAGDVSGDGRNDLVVANSYNTGTTFRRYGSVGIFVQNESGSLDLMREIPVGSQPYDVAVGDIDSDSRNEIVVANEVDNTIQVLHYGLPNPPPISSPTHPDPTKFSNQTRIRFALQTPADFDGIEGYWYVVDRSSTTVPDPATALFATADQTTTTVDVDVSDPSFGAGSKEGTWTIHAISRDRARFNGNLVTRYSVVLDLTPPTDPSNLQVGGTLTDRQRTLTWGGSTDALSGFQKYLIYLDGTLESSVTVPRVTFDDLPEGRHTATVKAQDKAGNISQGTSAGIVVDLQGPVIAMTSPVADKWVSGTLALAPSVTDTVGVTSVEFRFGGSVVRDTQAPYSATFDTRRVSGGSQTITIVATDIGGNTTTFTRTVRVDNNRISITGISDTPDPFYPVIKDGYKDKSVVRFHTNRTGTLKLRVYNSHGLLIREIVKSGQTAGNHTMTWDGKDKSGDVATGRFTYRIVAVNRAGLTTTSSAITTLIKNYEIVRIDPHTVKIVPR